MKRRLYAFAALLLAMNFVVSCGNTSGNSDTSSDTADNTPDTETSDRIAELGEKNFDGATFTILDTHGDINVNIPDESLEGDVVNDSVARRNMQIEETYNIVFAYPESNSNEKCQTLRNSVLASLDEYDMLFSHIPTAMGPLATEGLLADLCQMDQLSLDKNWWSTLVYENCRLDGIMYYTTGDISPISYRAPGCLYANSDLMEQYNISKDEIYDAVEDGKWTLDMLQEITGELDVDVNNDGKLVIADDFFGLLNEDNGLTAACFMVAAGVNMSSIDENGDLVVDLNNEKTITVIEKLSQVLSKVPRNDSNDLHNAFKADRTIFLMHYASSGYTRYRDLESDYIMLPLPKWDELQENYRSLVNTWCNAFVCVPVTADTDRAGFIMEVMAYWGRQMVRPDAYEKAVKIKGTRNLRDSAMLDIIYDSIYLDFNSIMEFGGTLNLAAESIFRDASWVSAITSVTQKMEADMESFSEAWTGESSNP